MPYDLHPQAASFANAPRAPHIGRRPNVSPECMPRLLDASNLPDADLVVLAQEGRDEAYRELIRRYERPVFSLVYRMVRDREAAEDLAQETFIKVLNNIEKYSPEFKFSSWLFKIANNLAIDSLRRRRLQTISIDGAAGAATQAEIEATSFEIGDRSENALDAMANQELGTAIEVAIAKLVRGDRATAGPAPGHRQDVHPPGAT